MLEGVHPGDVVRIGNGDVLWIVEASYSDCFRLVSQRRNMVRNISRYHEDRLTVVTPAESTVRLEVPAQMASR